MQNFREKMLPNCN